MKKMFLLGCAGRGVIPSSKQHPVSETELPVMEQFRIQKEAGLWDFVDRIPPDEASLKEYVAASEKYELPVLTGSWTYVLGQDEDVIVSNIDRAKRAGSKFHNLMVWAKHKDGHYVTNEEVVDCYLRTYDYGKKNGIEISFESHVDMWSEDFRRVSVVAEQVRKRGVPYNHCMDYSHNIFKIENEIEHAVSQIRGDAEAIRKLDPFNDDSYADEWLNQDMVIWAQVRPAAPNGPRNWWAGESGPFEGLGYDRPGRSIQYPFSKPEPGEWHTAEWHAHKLACTKELVRKVIDHYLQSSETTMQVMTIDNINLPAYGTGWKYNMYNDSCLVAKFVRELYAERVAVHEAKQKAASMKAFIDQHRP
ncbi:MAG: hypothetical protein DI587_24935 [Variovorax paradoxus]|nr:MAG: hypothetical protein DI583_24935 [Variovorax paradoxus]PZQ05461.1 MAG: hypothetical protein DI587_24935 [Variovorax paradoxus]